jgi:hypothetical protein
MLKLFVPIVAAVALAAPAAGIAATRDTHQTGEKAFAMRLLRMERREHRPFVLLQGSGTSFALTSSSVSGTLVRPNKAVTFAAGLNTIWTSATSKTVVAHKAGTVMRETMFCAPTQVGLTVTRKGVSVSSTFTGTTCAVDLNGTTVSQFAGVNSTKIHLLLHENGTTVRGALGRRFGQLFKPLIPAVK